MANNYDPYDPQVQYRALQDTLYVISGKWKVPIINSICNGNKRFKEIERSLPGITKRMLSKELKELEMNGIITRKVHHTTPVLIEYDKTEYCHSFAPIIIEMIKWGIEHRKKITKPEPRKRPLFVAETFGE
jgi:DNA-binding HxlR family transcriptional regulator